MPGPGGQSAADSSPGHSHPCSDPVTPPGTWTNLAFLPDNKTIAVGGGGVGEDHHKIFLLNVTTGLPTHCLVGHTDEVTSVAVTANGATLISASRDQTIKVWELKMK